jgi:crotonobetainyl-CoA:carnitine CoA-transferase CaiB-like acyl-CoA transferase
MPSPQPQRVAGPLSGLLVVDLIHVLNGPFGTTILNDLGARVIMAFAQLTYRESLRDIETCLSVQASKLYSMGFRDPVRRSTLADANEARATGAFTRSWPSD